MCEQNRQSRLIWFVVEAVELKNGVAKKGSKEFKTEWSILKPRTTIKHNQSGRKTRAKALSVESDANSDICNRRAHKCSTIVMGPGTTLFALNTRKQTISANLTI